jgi:hypothetical protein
MDFEIIVTNPPKEQEEKLREVLEACGTGMPP